MGMRIFIVGTSFTPSYGGPSVSVARLATELSALGADVGLWAPDGSVESAPNLPFEGGPRRMGGSLGEAFAAFGAPDIVHDNGVWLLHNHLLAVQARRVRVPRVVSTRGMLAPWALGHKAFKKRIAWFAYQKRDLRCAAMLHVTSELEERDVRALELGVPIFMNVNGIDLPATRKLVQGGTVHANVRTALFIGRLAPVKGLPILIDAWGRVRPEGWRLRIAGPDEAGYAVQLRRRVSELNLDGCIEFSGELLDEAKDLAFGDAAVVLVPSLSESFGVVVAEALSRARPVLTTDMTPWRDLQERNCGWTVPATVEGIAAGLRIVCATLPATLAAMGAAGREWMASAFTWTAVARRMLDGYESLRGSPG